MIKTYGLVFLALFLCHVAFAQQGTTMQRLQVKGNQFVTENLDTLVFQGLNASDPDKLEREGHWNKNYFEEIKNWGANIVRFPVHPTAWRKRGPEA